MRDILEDRMFTPSYPGFGARPGRTGYAMDKNDDPVTTPSEVLQTVGPDGFGFRLQHPA